MSREGRRLGPATLGALLAGVLVLSAGAAPTAAAHSRPAWPSSASPPLPRPVPHQGWVAPLPHLRVTEGFRPPPTRFAAGHRGVDLTAETGTPVRAAGSGVVSYAASLAGRGVVVVTHGALRTTYEPVAPLVLRGQQVQAGQVIGRLEAAGGHCRASRCLHWGLRRGIDYLDPLALLGASRVRLLPLASGPAPPDGGREIPGPESPAAGDGEPGWRLATARHPGVLAVTLLGLALVLTFARRRHRRGR